jgi:hypothetical protein
MISFWISICKKERSTLPGETAKRCSTPPAGILELKTWMGGDALRWELPNSNIDRVCTLTMPHDNLSEHG